MSFATLRALCYVVACLVGYYFFPGDRHGFHAPNAVQAAVLLAVLVMLAYLISRQVRRQILEEHGSRVESLVLLLALVVVVFAQTYLYEAKEFSGLITKTDSLYFTMTTLATVGFGDVHATGQGARITVTVQMAFDLVFVAALATTLGGVIRARAAELRKLAGKATDDY